MIQNANYKDKSYQNDNTPILNGKWPANVKEMLNMKKNHLNDNAKDYSRTSIRSREKELNNDRTMQIKVIPDDVLGTPKVTMTNFSITSTLRKNLLLIQYGPRC